MSSQRLFRFEPAPAPSRSGARRRQISCSTGTPGLAPPRPVRAGRGRLDAHRRRPLAQRHVRQRGAPERQAPPARRRHAALRGTRRSPSARPRPRARRAPSRGPAAVDLSTTQRRVLVALCRPYKERQRASPARPPTSRSPRSCSCPSARCKPTSRVLYAKFGVEDAARRTEKRVRLVERAFSSRPDLRARPLGSVLSPGSTFAGYEVEASSASAGSGSSTAPASCGSTGPSRSSWSSPKWRATP